MPSFSISTRLQATSLRLHWYLGHHDWKDVIDGLDGGFPRTRPPSLSWLFNHRHDAPWWEALRAHLGDEVLDNETAEYLKLELMAMARAWLWPAVYRQAMAGASVEHSVVMRYSFTCEYSLAASFRRDLAKLGEWWTHRIIGDAVRPLIVTRKELDSIDEEDEDCLELSDLLDQRVASADDLSEAIEQRLLRYRQETIEAVHWDSRYNEAFPSVGANLKIEELLQKERLGFALKNIETEVEGEAAWVRLVHNAVFEDAYGPQALAERVKKVVRQRLFAVFGPSAVAVSFKPKSNCCETDFRELLRRLLTSTHSNHWLGNGVPFAVKRKVRKRMGKQRWLGLRGKRDAVKTFLEEVDLPDYLAILCEARNRSLVDTLFRAVGLECPSKKTVSERLYFQKWITNRNHEAHARGNELTVDSIESLDETRRILTIWLLLTTHLDDSPSE